jgi:ATP-binding cassette subfamily G (WHITE) protein 1
MSGIKGIRPLEINKHKIIYSLSALLTPNLTLLQAGETRLGSITGSLQLNGHPSSGSDMKKVSGMVFQDDVVLGTMTVLEAVSMSAQLRLPSTLTVDEKQQKVSEIIQMLGLKKCEGTILGTATEKGVSGGERKRVCMAMELVTNPSVVYLDEPTSGLDTYTAHSVVSLLKDLARSGRTVIATLHQPSSEIFHLIDDLCIMVPIDVPFFPAPDHSNQLYCH